MSPKRIGIILFTVLAASGMVTYAAAEMGALQVVVENHRGEPVPRAMVYVSGGSGSDMYESGEKGSVLIELPEGKYSISSSLSEPDGELMNRFASPEAHIRVVSDDPGSVILTLYPLVDPVPDLTVSTLQKLGVAQEVAKFTNN